MEAVFNEDPPRGATFPSGPSPWNHVFLPGAIPVEAKTQGILLPGAIPVSPCFPLGGYPRGEVEQVFLPGGTPGALSCTFLARAHPVGTAFHLGAIPVGQFP